MNCKDTPQNREDNNNMGEDIKNIPQDIPVVDIQQQIEERRLQALNRQIFKKAARAAYYLGDGYIDTQRRTGGGMETRRTYSDPDAGAGLTIHFSRTADVLDCRIMPTIGGSLEILEGDELVFRQHGETIEGYIPGDWETELEKLQLLADRAKETTAKIAEQEQQAEKSERGDALRKAWGLSAKDSRTRGIDAPKPRTGGVVEQPQRRRRR